MFSASLRDVTTHLTDDLDSKHPANIQRKARGNLKALFKEDRFKVLWNLDGSVLKPHVPFPELEGEVAALVEPSTHAKCVAAITAAQNEKKRRGVKSWERVN